MRILQVAHALPSATLGGTELYTARLAESLARDPNREVAVAAARGDGSRVDVPTYSLSPSDDDADRERAPDADLDADADAADTDADADADVAGDAETDPSATFAVDDPGVDAAFADALAAFDPDVVHFHHLKGLSASLPERCRDRGIACVLTLHDFWTICHREQLFRPEGRLCAGPESVEKCADCYRSALATDAAPGIEAVAPESADADESAVDAEVESENGNGGEGGDVAAAEDAVARRASRLGDALAATDALVAPSAFLRERFVAFGADPDRVSMRRNGILTERFEDTGFDPDDGPTIFVYAGRIVPLKGVHVLVDAFADVDADAELHVYGAFDPEGDAYHARLRDRAGERVRFHGRYEESAAPYRRADAFVLPSLWYENSPIVIQEAFASRVPVIAGDAGGMAELVADGRDGLTFPVGDRAALADRLAHLAANPDAIRELRRGIDSPKHLDRNTAETVALYRECLADDGDGDGDGYGYGDGVSASETEAESESRPGPPPTEI